MRIVLVIDDDPMNNYLIESLLNNPRTRVYSATNAEDGFELAAALSPNLIIMDIRLTGAGLDGWQATAYLKADPQLGSIPVLAVCAADLDGDREAALEAGCSAYVPKPYNIVDFRNLIESFLPAAS